MRIIGLALSGIEKLVLGPRFLMLTALGKFALWPFAVFCLTQLDAHIFGLFDRDIHLLLLVMSIMPPAANIAAFAMQLNLRPEKAATTMLITTLFALAYIPAMVIVFGMY